MYRSEICNVICWNWCAYHTTSKSVQNDRCLIKMSLWILIARLTPVIFLPTYLLFFEKFFFFLDYLNNNSNELLEILYHIFRWQMTHVNQISSLILIGLVTNVIFFPTWYQGCKRYGRELPNEEHFGNCSTCIFLKESPLRRTRWWCCYPMLHCFNAFGRLYMIRKNTRDRSSNCNHCCSEVNVICLQSDHGDYMTWANKHLVNSLHSRVPSGILKSLPTVQIWSN